MLLKYSKECLEGQLKKEMQQQLYFVTYLNTYIYEQKKLLPIRDFWKFFF